MSDQIAEIIDREFVATQNNGVGATLLSNNYFVSTTRLLPQTKIMDALLELKRRAYGVTKEQLLEAGFFGMNAKGGEYETMVFEWYPDEDRRSNRELAVARYDTVEEAEEGHKEMVERWRRMPAPE